MYRKSLEHIRRKSFTFHVNIHITGIPIVQLEDPDLAKEVGLFAFPSIVFFRNFGHESVIYAGDIKNEASILEWLLVQMDPSNEAIDNQEGEELESAIENYDSIAVFICKLMVSQ